MRALAPRIELRERIGFDKSVLIASQEKALQKYKYRCCPWTFGIQYHHQPSIWIQIFITTPAWSYISSAILLLSLKNEVNHRHLLPSGRIRCCRSTWSSRRPVRHFCTLQRQLGCLCRCPLRCRWYRQDNLIPLWHNICGLEWSSLGHICPTDRVPSNHQLCPKEQRSYSHHIHGLAHLLRSWWKPKCCYSSRPHCCGDQLLSLIQPSAENEIWPTTAGSFYEEPTSTEGLI